VDLEFKVQPKKIKLTNGDGVEFSLRCPSMKEVQDIEQKIKEIEPALVINAMSEYFVSLGLPKAEAEKLDADTFIDLFQFVNGAKKKI
jgi:hypothetical protein